MTIFQRILCGSFTVLLAGSSVHPQAQAAGQKEDSCREFVQQFYDWYLPKAQTANSSGEDLVLKSRRSAFSRELLLQLKQDSEAQARAKGELVGLDFDPFLNTQDPGFERCTVGTVVPKGGSYWAEVSCVFPGPNGEKANVTPELALNQGRWVFMNFHYKDGSREYDLLQILKGLRQDRKPRQHKSK